ncbi:BTAD domain-containing putative transcriptional regulator [Phyllobacterium myrsinacearum]|uniref:DNA-binding SARP family transcriptional activator n=1 Tax=Phyllobacterium myrsinacearum TaxID=28101 RepID=A0A839EG24_9HYPH|nr:BTAD domain-containing putative transcriptional regulator [Phyllobacterium myrsinacearum]MBA8878921.1 DNA-binding SARP family transcriptional activator [Phyllobacterium myrsinacearum]
MTLESGPITWVPANFFRILAYLLLEESSHSVSRSKLAQILWSDSDPSHALVNLRQSLARIRKFQDQNALNLIQMDAIFVSLNLEQVRAGLVWIDVMAVIGLSQNGDVESVLECCDAYRGDLLEQNLLQHSDFDDWLDIKRVELRDTIISLLKRVLDHATVMPVEAKCQCARKLIEIDAYQEVGYRTLMRVAGQLGQPGKVERLFRECAGKLRDDLDVDPEEQTIRLYRDLISQSQTDSKGQQNIPRQDLILFDTGLNSVSDDVFEGSQKEASHEGLPKIAVIHLAVNPMDPMEQLAASLVDDITLGLCQLNTLWVVAPYTASQIATSSISTLHQTSKGLGIDYIINSKVTQIFGSYVLSVCLIKIGSQEVVWVESHKFDDVLPEQQYRQISIRIILSVASVIEKKELERYNQLSRDPTAYSWYLIGQGEVDKFDVEKLHQARQSFKNALNVSRDFAPALSGIARSMHREWLVLDRDDNFLLLEAEKIAQRAAMADTEDGRPLHELGIISMYLGRFEDSLDYFDQAESKSHQHADLLADYSDALLHYGNLDLALAKIKHAFAHNPLAPDHYFWTAAGILHNLGQHANAIDYLSRMKNPRVASRLMAACWAELGENKEANRYKSYNLAGSPKFRIGDWARNICLRLPVQLARNEASFPAVRLQ